MALAKFYGQALVSAFNKEIDFDGDTFKVILLSSSYAPNQDTHRYKSDLSNEVTGTGYTAGGATLANVTVAYDSSTNTLKFDADDVSWNPSTITARYAVVYDNSPGTDSARPLICYIDFQTDQSSNNDLFSITWSPSGIATLVAA